MKRVYFSETFTTLFRILLLWCTALPLLATTYYLSVTGSDNASGLTETQAWATFSHAGSYLHPGDTLLIMDGTYHQRIVPTASGNATDGYITYKAQHDFQVILKPTASSDHSGKATIDVFSCPDCGNSAPTKAYLWFEGIVARGYGEASAINLYSGDNVLEANQTHHIVVKKCGFYGSAQETNTPVISTGPGFRDSLMEDIFAYGRGRKAAEIFSSLRITIRRAVMRYDYWEGDDYKPSDPRVSFTGYNVHDSIFENIIAIDSAPTPPGYSADRSGVAIEGNETPGGFSNSQNNKYLGIVILNNYGNGVESDSGADTPNRNILMENILIWKSLGGGGDGLDVNGNDDSSVYRYITTGKHEASGVRINQYPNPAITNETLTHIFSTQNGRYGFYYGSSQVSVFANNTSKDNGEEDATEISYAPDISQRFLDPVMVAGHKRGATIVNRYVDGEQTDTPLWPYPYEDSIKQHMCNPADLAEAHRVAANGEDWEPGWCATNKTLTAYIWEANGATCPSDICTYTTAPQDTTPPTRSNGTPTGELSSGTTSTTMSLDTNENATCRYSTQSDQAYFTMTPFSSTGSTHHSTVIVSLEDGNSFVYYVKCQDLAGNTNTDDYPIKWSINESNIEDGDDDEKGSNIGHNSSSGGGGAVWYGFMILSLFLIVFGRENIQKFGRPF